MNLNKFHKGIIDNEYELLRKFCRGYGLFPEQHSREYILTDNTGLIKVDIYSDNHNKTQLKKIFRDYKFLGINFHISNMVKTPGGHRVYIIQYYIILP